MMKPYAKALAAFLVAASGALATAAVDSSVVLGEALSALAAAVAAAGAVFGVRNVSRHHRPPHVPSPGNPPIR